MSQEPVERLNGVVEAFNAGGVDAALPYFHPEFVWNAPPEWLEKSVYRGHGELRELAAAWGENFDEYRLEVERVIDLGDRQALALLYQRGRIKGSGLPIEQAIAWIVEPVDGPFERVDVYFNWEAALEAAGLSE